MARRDAEGKAMQKWLYQLGCPTKLHPKEFDFLLTPTMRPVWHHMQAYIKPVQSVQTIRKNLLVAKLGRENIIPNQLCHYKIQSVSELALIEKITDLQDRLGLKKSAIHSTENEINSLICHLVNSKYKIKVKESEIKEVNEKISLMNLKLVQVQKNIKELNDDIVKATLYDTLQMSNSNVDVLVDTIMSNLVLGQSFSQDDQVLMYDISKQYSMETVYQAFSIASNVITKTLKQYYINLKIPFENSSKSTILSFSKIPKTIKSSIIQNELTITRFQKQIETNQSALQKEIVEFLELINGHFSIHDNCTALNDVGESTLFLDKLVNIALNISKIYNLNNFIADLKNECEEYDHLKHVASANKKKEMQTYREVTEQVNIINKLYFKTFNFKTDIGLLRTQIVSTCRESVPRFLETRKVEISDVFLESEDMIINEITTFYKSSLTALLRTWEHNCELVPINLVGKRSLYQELRNIFFQSEPKDILKYILEKKWWNMLFYQ